MIAVQGVMRFPVNLRPWVFTPKTCNPKGLALFVQGLLVRYRNTLSIAPLKRASRYAAPNQPATQFTQRASRLSHGQQKGA